MKLTEASKNKLRQLAHRLQESLDGTSGYQTVFDNLDTVMAKLNECETLLTAAENAQNSMPAGGDEDLSLLIEDFYTFKDSLEGYMSAVQSMIDAANMNEM